MSRILLGFLLVLSLTACGMLPAAPGWQRAGQAARRAALAPQTWLPLAGAAVFQTGDFDRRLSDWASEHHPVFRSQQKADRASDLLLFGAAAAYGGTIVAAHAGEAERWKLRFANAINGGSAVLTTGGTTLLLKEAVGRERPDGSGNASFPSLHSAGTAVFSILAVHNLDHMPLSEGQRALSRAGLGALTISSAWARIEAAQHYPSDVLTGAALGHFFGTLFNDTFLPPGSAVTLQPEIALRGERFGLRLQVMY